MTDEPAPPPVDTATQLAWLVDARRAFAALRPRVMAGAPWALAVDFGTGPEASWGPREVLAHTAEMLPFWLGEYERIVEAGRGTGDPVPFGRASGDALRVGILERDRTLPLRELFARIDAGIERWERRLSAADARAGEDAAVGLHPRDGEVPATWVRDRFVVRHLEEHLAQLEEILARP
jgi:hypothetical protein